MFCFSFISDGLNAPKVNLLWLLVISAMFHLELSMKFYTCVLQLFTYIFTSLCKKYGKCYAISNSTSCPKILLLQQRLMQQTI